MTVETLEAATRITEESPDTVAAIYEYIHAITGKKLWSVESWSNKGCTLESGMVLCPRLIYDGYEMEWIDAQSE
jgi:hypothetical protein